MYQEWYFSYPAANEHVHWSTFSHQINNRATVISSNLCRVSSESAFLRWAALEIYGYFLSAAMSRLEQ